MRSWFKKDSKNSSRVYLDAAAASPVSPEAFATFTKALVAYGNPSSPHAEGRAAKEILEEARIAIARLAEVKSDAVIFTGNATEANALAIEGHIRALAEQGRAYTDMHVLYLPSSHASVIGSIRQIESYGVSVEEIPLAGAGIDFDALKERLRTETVLVCVDAVCSETGVRFDTREVRRVVDAARKTLGTGSAPVIHVDASQLPLSESFERMRIGADTYTLDAQKVGGVRGIGALIAPSTVALVPIVRGGGQERGLRSGTESPALAASFAVALLAATRDRAAFVEQSRKQRALLTERLSHIPNIFITEGKKQAPHILNVSFLGRDTDYLVALLDEAGFSVATKSACETDETGSRAVYAYTKNTMPHETAMALSASTLRLSWSSKTTDHDLERFACALADAVSFLDTNV